MKQRSLNDEYRDLLANYANSGQKSGMSFWEFVEKTSGVRVNRKYIRGERNEAR